MAAAIPINCVIIGDRDSNKHELCCVASGVDLHAEYIPIFIDKIERSVEVYDQPYLLTLYNTSGMEEYNRLLHVSCKDADVILLCLNVERMATIESIVNTLYPQITVWCPNVPCIGVGLQTNSDPEISIAADVLLQQIARLPNMVASYPCDLNSKDSVQSLLTNIAKVFHERKPFSIEQWLTSIGLSEYLPLFLEEKITTVEHVKRLTDKELRSIFSMKLGDIYRFLDAQHQL